MEVNTAVWLRRANSEWGWVPAMICDKQEVNLEGTPLIRLTLRKDDHVEGTTTTTTTTTTAHPQHQLHRSGSNYFEDEPDFEVELLVDPESLKKADHEDIKLRNLPSSHEDAHMEDGSMAEPSTLMHPTIVGGVQDLIGLTHLHEPAILHALRLRYDADIIYTATGPILIAVNPFKAMPDLYSPGVMESYRVQGEQGVASPASNSDSATAIVTPTKQRRGGAAEGQALRLPPHVYQTADDAYRQMIRGVEAQQLLSKKQQQEALPCNQSILVSGESGAGKTVTTKIVLNYLAMLSKKRSSSTISPRSNSPTVSIEQQVLQSNPILEAFGNARTIRNDNSSRFGKYIDVAFSKQGKLAGASIETYLLEKVRLIHPSPGERNYHVFYQFLQAATHKERRDFFIGSKTPRDFRLLSDSGTFDRRDHVSDEESHLEMLQAMVRCLDCVCGCIVTHLASRLTHHKFPLFTPTPNRSPLDFRTKRFNPSCALYRHSSLQET